MGASLVVTHVVSHGEDPGRRHNPRPFMGVSAEGGIRPGIQRSSGFIGTLGSLVAELDNKKQPFSLALKSAGKVMRESDAFCRRNSLINNIIKAGRSLNAGPNTTP